MFHFLALFFLIISVITDWHSSSGLSLPLLILSLAFLIIAEILRASEGEIPPRD